MIFITHNVIHAMTVGDHFGVLIKGALAADFRKGERTREEITDLMAGGESMAELEAEVQSYMETHDGPRASARSTERRERFRSAPDQAPIPPPGSAPAQTSHSNAAPEAARSQVMKIALDPFMHRHLSLEELPSKVAELGYEWIELSPRGDFLEWFKAPRVFPDRIKTFKKALERRQRRHRLAAADVPLGLERRGSSARRPSSTGSAPSRSPSSSASTR